MKVRLEVEPHDYLPSKLLDGLKRAIASAMEVYGLAPDVRVVGEQMEAYQRFLEWNEKRLNGGNESA